MNRTPVRSESVAAWTRFESWWLKPDDSPVDHSGQAHIDFLYDQPRAEAKVVAVRKQMKVFTDRARFLREMQLNRQFFAGDLFLAGSDTHVEKCWMVLRYLSGGSLRQRFSSRRRIPDCQALLRKIAQCVDKNLSLNVLHRDIKPENLMFEGPGDDDRLYLIDYGMAVEAGKVGAETAAPENGRVGTPAYMAQERRNGEPASVATEIREFVITAIEVARYCGNFALAAQFEQTSPDARHGFDSAEALLDAVFIRSGGGPDAELLAKFWCIAERLFGPKGPLGAWQGQGLLPRIRSLLSSSHPRKAPSLVRFVRHEVTSKLIGDIKDSRVSLSKSQLGNIAGELVSCMDVAIQLCIDPQRRNELIAFKNALIEDPDQTAPLQLPVETRISAIVAVRGVTPVHGQHLSETADQELENGAGEDARFGFAEWVIQRLIATTPLGKPISVRSPEEYKTWKGKFADDQAGGKSRILVLRSDEYDKLGSQKIGWLCDLHILVIKLDGAGSSSFWQMNEHRMNATVTNFVDDVKELLKKAETQ